jgi:UDP-N-acetylmuramoyl-L-alanyl-D-glutamate--2,6-diaminopimelate ligase
MYKTLGDLLEGINHETTGDERTNVSGITDNSKNVKDGNLFIAVKGIKHDGHNFIEDAIKSGASVIVGEIKPKRKWSSIAYVQVENSRKVLGIVASNWFGNPSNKLKVIGVTGTDGKTTTASMIYHILNSCGKKAGLVSTVSAKIGDREYDTGFHVTNPDPISLQGFLAKMVEANCKYAIVEVTSHGIDQERISGIEFETAVLTNISNEHLDYHKDFEHYRNTKVKLFKRAKRSVVLNKDDASFDYILKNIQKRIGAITYSLKDKSADLYVTDTEEKLEGMNFLLVDKGRSSRDRTSIDPTYWTIQYL